MKNFTEQLGRFVATVKGSLNRIEAQQKGILEILHTIKSGHRNDPAKLNYTPAEVASLLGKKTYTVREWCRLRRIRATKRSCGRGAAYDWEISHREIERIKNHGLLPAPKRY